MEDGSGSPTLEVGFAIDTGGSYDQLFQLQRVMGSAEAQIVKEAANIERATGGMLNLGGATASMRAFGASVTREGASAARELNRVEKAGEALSRQLDRQASTFGKSREEIRALKVESAALAAEQKGLTELAGRLRSQEANLFAQEVAAARAARFEAEAAAEAKAAASARAIAAAEAEAEAIRRAANAYNMFEAVAKQRSAAYKQRQAEEAEAERSEARLVASAERLRASIDPSTAAQQRFNREMAEARTLISAGAISLDEYVAKLRMERTALDQSSSAHGRAAGAAMNNRMAMQGASYQVQDFITQVSMGANPINAFAVQGAQLAGQFSMVEGRAGAVARFFMSGWGLGITAGLMVLAPFLGKLLDTNNALDDALDKLKKDAAETEATAKAKDKFATSVEGVRAAILEQKRALEESAKALYSQVELTWMAAKGELEREVRIRSTTKALLEQALVEAEQFRQQEERLRKGNRTTGSLAGREGADVMGMAVGVTEARVAALKASVAEQTSLIDTAQRNLNGARVGLIFEIAKQQSTAVGKVTREYDNQIRALRRTADAQAAAGKTIDASLTREILSLERRKQAAIEAANAQERLNKATDGVARFRTREQAIGVAGKELQGAGMRVDGNVQFGVTGGHKNNADHNRYAIDVNVGKGVVEANIPHLKKQYDELALLYQSRGYDVIWNNKFYAAGGKGGRTGGYGHRDHMDIKAPRTIVGKATQGSTARLEMAEFKDAIKDATEAEAVQAQTANLYALSKAYEASGGAALVAAARVKAESEAIRESNDVGAAVAREVGLEIAQRVAAAAQNTATMRDQATAQASVNAMVAAGNIPAERAAELVQNQLADLPLLAAIQAAQATKNVEGAARATEALEAQRAARKRLADEERQAAFNTVMASGADRLAEMREELRLVGATDAARTMALATLRATREAEKLGVSPEDRAAYIAQQLDIARLSIQLATGQNAYNESLSYTRDLMAEIGDHAGTLSDILSGAFGGFGDSVGGLLTTLTDLQERQQSIADWRRDEMEKAGGNATRLAQIEVLAAKQSQTAQMKATAQAISGVKSLFKEKSTAFKVISTIEKAYAVWQAAETVASLVRDATKTASHLANSAVRTTANTAEGGSKIFAELGPWGFPVVAAMVAVLAALGARGGGGGRSGPSIPSSDDLQAGAGTGTVLGDPKTKSESIARSLEIVAANTNSDLEYSNAMLKALRSIDSSIGEMAGTVARQIQVSGSMFDTSKLKLGTSGGGGFLGIGASSTTKELWDLGMKLNSASVADIIASGITGSTYQTVQKIKKKSGFLGIGGGTKTSYETATGSIDGDITAAIQDVVRSLRDGLIMGADLIGLQGAQAILDSFQVNLGTLSFKGMTGEQIEDQLNAIFSSVGDQMAGKLVPSLASMQLIGEGLFETFMRVAKEYEAVEVALRSIGRTFGMVGLESVAARDNLVQLFGGLDEFVERTSFFRDKFLTEAQQMAPIQAAVSAEMQRLGLTGVTTRNQFRDIVLGLDLTTASGRDLYASLMSLAPAYDKVLDYQEQMQKKTVDGLQQTFDQFSKFADGLRKYRDTLFATSAAQGNAYGVLRAKFIATSEMAAQGNAGALGELENAGKAFLDTARNNASTREQYLRDVALVARGVDSGIFAAEETADYAKLQLDAMANAVSFLGAINANTAATAAALSGSAQTSNAALLDAAGTNQAATPSYDSSADLHVAIEDLRNELAELRRDTNAGNATIASNTGRIARKLEDVTAASGGDALSMVSPA